MVKKFIKFMLALGLLLSIFHFQIKSEDSVIDFDSYLQLQDFEFLEMNERGQNEPMVFIAPDVIDLLANINSVNQVVKDLVEHIKMGYCVASQAAVKQAVEEMMQSGEIAATERTALAEYKEALIDGDALIQPNSVRRVKREGKFCNLFVKKCAEFGCARVLGNLNVCGTISACNFTAFTGTTGGIVLPGAVVEGNIIFNEAGANPLFAQGTLEKNTRDLRGSIAFSSGAITLIGTVPGEPITVGGILPTPRIFRGIGYSLGSITATAASSGIASDTINGHAYSIALSFQMPITFVNSYLISPTVVLGFETINDPVLVSTHASVSLVPTVINATASGVRFAVVFNILAEGVTYAAALHNAAALVNNILTTSGFINFLCQGPVA